MENCYTLEEQGLWDRSGCCISCHEDHNIGYDLLEAVLPDGREAELCCNAYRELIVKCHQW